MSMKLFLRDTDRILETLAVAQGLGCLVFGIISRFEVHWLLVYVLYVGLPPDKHAQIPRSAHTVYLCVLCGSQNKQRLFPYKALTDWFV
jgi:hypothetical protein